MTLTIFLLIYLAGCVVCYGLNMGHHIHRFGRVLGVRPMDVRFAFSFGATSWLGAVITWFVGDGGHFSLNTKRRYPTDAFHKKSYIEEYGEIV